MTEIIDKVVQVETRDGEIVTLSISVRTSNAKITRVLAWSKEEWTRNIIVDGRPIAGIITVIPEKHESKTVRLRKRVTV